MRDEVSFMDAVGVTLKWAAAAIPAVILTASLWTCVSTVVALRISEYVVKNRLESFTEAVLGPSPKKQADPKDTTSVEEARKFLDSLGVPRQP